MEQNKRPVSEKKLIVAAIDFGTTYSGYAYSFLHDYKNDKLKIHANTNWSDGQTMCTLKTPTVILFDKDGKFDSFGFEAESKYSKLSAACTEESEDSDSPEYKHIGWRYFRRFKMELFKRKRLRLDMTLKDDQNNKMPAIDVFAASIRFLKDHLLKRLSERLLGDITQSDIQWVITVPAIWRNSAKQFMQEAAERAGIPESQICIALEPEAAALYCKEIIVSKASERNDSQLQPLKPGAQFMIMDFGGGTVDITVHEVQSDDTLKELVEPSGGPWGGTLVDDHLNAYFEELFGKDVMKKFKDECKTDELDLQRNLELKKRVCNGSVSEDGRVIFSVPSALYDLFREIKGEQFKIPLSNNSEVKQLRGGKLRFEPTVFNTAFEQSKTSIISHVRHLLERLTNVKTILMVGGFAESEIMKQAVMKEFENNMSVIVPEDAAIAVVKGAVMYGQATNLISSRILRHTYGISTAIPFNPRVHPPGKRSGQQLDKCEDVFKVFIRAGEIVSPDNTKVTHTVCAPTVGASIVTIEIYQSDYKNPVFVTDDGCQRVADLLLTLERKPLFDKQKIDITMWFGDTVLHVDACEQDTNNKVSANFNFLI